MERLRKLPFSVEGVTITLPFVEVTVKPDNTEKKVAKEIVIRLAERLAAQWCGHLPCYKFEMPKTIEQWLLFKYVSGEFTPLSKPYKTKEQAEKARSKYPERERKTIGLGVVRLPKGE